MSETDLTAVRHRAWKTRRQKYGPRGHNSTYSRPAIGPCDECRRLTNYIVRLHINGTLSEGQAASALGRGRIYLRILADDMMNAAPPTQEGKR